MSQTPVADLHTLTVGESGPRVAFLHGLFGQGRNWMQIAKALAGPAGTGARALLVDLPNHGRSPWTQTFDYREIADRVADQLRAVGGADRWNLVGHSLGGKVAMTLALRHPDLLERLCVVDIAPVGYGDLSRFAGYIEGMRAMPLDEIGDRAAAEAWFEHVDEDPGVRAFLLQNLRRDSAGWAWQPNLELVASDAAAGRESAIAGFPDAGGATFDGPVLWLAGSESGYVREENEPGMRALFPRVRLVRVRGAGHWVHSQAPEVTVEALRMWLAKPLDSGGWMGA